MTLNELRTEVRALGLEPGAHTDPFLISAANRALAMICAEIPILKTLHAPAASYAPSYYLAELHHARGERTSLVLAGRAYSFWASGVGSFTKTSDTKSTAYDFDTPISNFRGFIDGSVEIVFEGDYDFDILGLSVFDRLVSDELEDIPTDFRNRIVPDELVDDFFAFAELPRDDTGEIIEGSRFEGRCALLPPDYRGLITPTYESLPRVITTSSTKIEISPSAVHLLPILTAYFLWLDDEPTLAESYLELYRSLLNTVKRKVAPSSAEYRDALGWS